MKNQKKLPHLLWFSPYAPYDTVKHAGGQDFNHFLKYLNYKKQFEIHVATLCLTNDIDKLDFSSYNIPHTCLSINKNKSIYHLGLIADKLAFHNPFHYCGSLLSPYTRLCFRILLYKLKKTNFIPDIILLHWTQSALLLPLLKKKYPTAVYIMFEVDVAYLGYQRILQQAKGKYNKFLWKQKYKHLKYSELYCAQQADNIIVLNQKDADLLIKDNIASEKIFVSVPYYHNYGQIVHKPINNNILFFGYMGREENHLSALWFIQNVMPLLSKDYHFIIIGTEPKEELLNLETKNIHILGYVEDVIPYFRDSLCLAAPLILGAGIKIKILEALSAGIPVLTNSIGIEGISASDKKDFFYCETPEEYAVAINNLKDLSISDQISKNAKEFMKLNFDTNKKLDVLIDRLYSL